MTIGNSVTSIGYNAFWSCPSLISVTSLNTTPPTIGNEQWGAFEETTVQNAILYVPTGSKGAYQQAEYWEDFLNIEDDVVTGMESTIANKQGKTAIYTLDGKRLNATNAADLPKGIYIINGKKVMVK